jgi:ribosomal protein L24
VDIKVVDAHLEDKGSLLREWTSRLLMHTSKTKRVLVEGVDIKVVNAHLEDKRAPVEGVDIKVVDAHLEDKRVRVEGVDGVKHGVALLHLEAV